MTNRADKITMSDIADVSNGRLIDRITEAAVLVRGLGSDHAMTVAISYFKDVMTEGERLAFPFFLVRMRDEFAEVAEARDILFARSVCRLARIPQPQAA